MQSSKVLPLAAAFLFLIIAARPTHAGEPSGRPLPFETLVESDRAGPEARTFAFAANADAWREAFAGSEAPQVKVDYKSELVLVAALGTQSASGHGVKIVRVLADARPGESVTITVEVEERTPARDEPVEWVNARPVHAVKVKRPPGDFTVKFTKPVVPVLLNGATLEVTEGERVTQLVLTADGKVTLKIVGPSAPRDAIEGRASLDELDELTQAAGGADLPRLPRGALPKGDGSSFHATIKLGERSFALEGRLGRYGAYATKLRPLIDALRTIERRLAASTEAPKRREVAGVVTLRDGRVTIDEDGRTVLEVENEPFARLLRDCVGRRITGFGRVAWNESPAGRGVKLEWLGARTELESKLNADTVASRSELRVTGARGKWVEVELEDGRRGFLRASFIGVGARR